MITGCCLEIVHGWKPLALLYFGGALIADFGDLIGGTGLYGCGASGAISALYVANLATVILVKENYNYKIKTMLKKFSMELSSF